MSRSHSRRTRARTSVSSDSSVGSAPTGPHPTSPGSPSPTFADLGVPTPLVAALAASGIDRPFPVQVATLPSTLAGRDTLGRGRTGSGKTLAFALPLVARLAGVPSTSGRPRGLVLAPTRELARQIAAVLDPLARTVGLSVATIFGGVAQSRQVAALRAAPDIVVACPGRLEDLIGQGHLTLSEVEITVLDEADHMADLGFLPAVRRLLDQVPAGQRLLFSATLDSAVDSIVARYLTDPVTHSLVEQPAQRSTMSHELVAVEIPDRLPTLISLVGTSPRTIVFTRTKHRAKRLAHQLVAAGVSAVELHGNLSQPRRVANLEAFSAGTSPVLVATDIAARGIHVDDVELVVHADPPVEHKAYLHRSGRTARAGACGRVVTLVADDQRSEVARLTRAAGIHPTLVSLPAIPPAALPPSVSHTSTTAPAARASSAIPVRTGGWSVPIG